MTSKRKLEEDVENTTEEPETKKPKFNVESLDVNWEKPPIFFHSVADFLELVEKEGAIPVYSPPIKGKMASFRIERFWCFPDNGGICGKVQLKLEEMFVSPFGISEFKDKDDKESASSFTISVPLSMETEAKKKFSDNLTSLNRKLLDFDRQHIKKNWKTLVGSEEKKDKTKDGKSKEDIDAKMLDKVQESNYKSGGTNKNDPSIEYDSYMQYKLPNYFDDKTQKQKFFTKVFVFDEKLNSKYISNFEEIRDCAPRGSTMKATIDPSSIWCVKKNFTNTWTVVELSVLKKGVPTERAPINALTEEEKKLLLPPPVPLLLNTDGLSEYHGPDENIDNTDHDPVEMIARDH